MGSWQHLHLECGLEVPQRCLLRIHTWKTRMQGWKQGMSCAMLACQTRDVLDHSCGGRGNASAG